MIPNSKQELVDALRNSAPANAARFSPQLEQVQVLRLNFGAVRIDRQNECIKADELWHGSAYAATGEDDRDIPIYLRLSEPLPVVAELLCAVIGRALGLPVPQPFMVIVERGALPGSRLLDPTAAASWAFASADVGGDSFAQLLRGDSASAQAMLRQWAHLVPVAVFDEWLANTDRNHGNILFAANALWIIDHAEALGGSARKLFPLSDITSDMFANQLGELLAKEAHPDARSKYLKDAQQWLWQGALDLDIAQAVACAGVAYWHSESERAELIDFLTARLTLAHSLLCNRLGHPQLTLPSPPPAGASAFPASAP